MILLEKQTKFIGARRARNEHGFKVGLLYHRTILLRMPFGLEIGGETREQRDEKLQA
jgi:ABC-type proline/glycine betaine transport system ATPase subunit